MPSLVISSMIIVIATIMNYKTASSSSSSASRGAKLARTYGTASKNSRPAMMVAREIVVAAVRQFIQLQGRVVGLRATPARRPQSETAAHVRRWSRGSSMLRAMAARMGPRSRPLDIAISSLSTTPLSPVAFLPEHQLLPSFSRQLQYVSAMRDLMGR